MPHRKEPFAPTRIAVIGNYLPRQCGIATFTTDLCDSLAAERAAETLFALAVNDVEGEYSYPERVRFELAEGDLTSYRNAAEFLNFSNVDMVCLQHEYGIFGGPAGSHILWLLQSLKMPIVTTLHTVLSDPNPEQRMVMEQLAELSDRLIVMSEHSSTFLRDIYHVPTCKIDLIPHGVPDLPFVDPNFYKASVGAEGKSVILTFGLLSPNKGIENVIRAMPHILARHKNVVYVVTGATHPHIRRREGDSYRRSLEALAHELGVDSNVIFHNRFVTPEELVEFLGSADIYITPYRSEGQVVSGTLAYALSTGKAIISTPYLHARELLAEGRGVLVPFDDPKAIAAAAIGLFDNDPERHAMRKRAYLHAREMTWRKVAQKYMASFARARSDRATAPRPTSPSQMVEKSLDRLPPIKLDHLLRLTDDTGILQHALFVVPNCAEGYTTDDNARALALTILLEQLTPTGLQDITLLASRYLGFLGLAFDPKTKRFRNWLSYGRRWLDAGSEDSHGRALWALGTVLGRSREPGLVGAAGRLFEQSLVAIKDFTSPRAWAFALLGLHEYSARFAGDRDVLRVRNLLAARLADVYARCHSAEWNWYEDSLSYANATLPHSLLTCANDGVEIPVVSTGLATLSWLNAIQRVSLEGHFVPVGSLGFYRRDGQKARFDQQPIEAGATVSACLEAFRITGNECWRREAWRAFNWFLGGNDLGIVLHDSATGGCRDGLHPERANENQGAESTLVYLTALLEMRLSELAETRPIAQDDVVVADVS